MFSYFESLLTIFLGEDEVQFSELGEGGDDRSHCFRQPQLHPLVSWFFIAGVSELELRFVHQSVTTHL